jgi:hypothetical protein
MASATSAGYGPRADKADKAEKPLVAATDHKETD